MLIVRGSCLVLTLTWFVSNSRLVQIHTLSHSLNQSLTKSLTGVKFLLAGYVAADIAG
jgi:hypothetical protein